MANSVPLLNAERPPAPAESGSPATSRLAALDQLRGLIIIAMALDHANYFVARLHSTGEFWGGPFPHYDSLLPFLTRFVSHFAAPGFFFLMGTSLILLSAARRRAGWTERQIAGHLATRGLVLIALQFLLENMAWALGPSDGGSAPGSGGGHLYFGVLYGLGGAMIVGSALLRAPAALLLGLSAAAVLATQALIPAPSEAGVLWSPWLRLLLIPGTTGEVMVYYPLLPWLGVTCFGMAFGRWLQNEGAAALSRGAAIGAGFIGLFVLVRAADGFGNIRTLEGPGWMAFLNLTKYPPSLTFLLLTLGVNLVLLALFARVPEAMRARWGKPLTVFGQSALFFYICHLFVYALLGMAFAPQGTGLIGMYPVWLAGLAMLYPACLWYGRFKRRQPPTSVWRLF